MMTSRQTLAKVVATDGNIRHLHPTLRNPAGRWHGPHERHHDDLCHERFLAHAPVWIDPQAPERESAYHPGTTYAALYARSLAGENLEPWRSSWRTRQQELRARRQAKGSALGVAESPPPRTMPLPPSGSYDALAPAIDQLRSGAARGISADASTQRVWIHEAQATDLDERLYSGQLDERYRATLEAGRLVLSTRWPLGCFGAANAFLTLIGPSPGGAGPGEVRQAGGINRPQRDPMQIGQGVLDLNWGDHRTAKWTKLCSAMLGSESHALALTAVLNLDWRHSTDERSIPLSDLTAGLEQHVWPLLTALRPRIVCALTNRVWETMVTRVRPLQVSLADCPVPLTRPPVVFKLPGCDFDTILIKSHNHPSRVLSYAQIADLGRVCSWFLGSGASRAYP
jgi:hypothetical protein